MTIEVNYNPIRQQGNGVTKDFSYDFYALSDQYLVVYIEEDGVQTVTTDYTATVSETGGIVTFNVAPTENQYVVITRSTTINQEVPYTTSRGFDAKVVESSFDKDIAISQELQNQLTRTPKLPEGYNYNVQLPNNPDDGKALVWSGSEGKMRNSDYTLDESMVRAAASAELSKDWAEKTTGLVSGDFSSKAYAIGGTGTETNNAKYYASQASNSADIAYAAATNENVVAVGTDLRTDNNIGAVVGNATNINNVAGNATNINNVASNRTNINAVAGSIANVNTTATNINAVNTTANNIVAIQNASANAQLARDWAIKTDGLVSGEDYSAKYWADQARQSAAGAVVDNISINRNTDDELQTIGVINQNAPTTAIKTWTGTLAQYNAIVSKDSGTLYYLTDAQKIYYGTNLVCEKFNRNIGEIITSSIPLTDAGLHLLDGSLIQGGGIYNNFVQYIANLFNLYPQCFTDETTWQNTVNSKGVCGKFVYDSVNNTVRLPKITGFIEGTVDINALGDLINAGLPNITGTFGGDVTTGFAGISGAFTSAITSNNSSNVSNPSTVNAWGFDASLSNSIYGNSSTVQPQSIKVFYYIVIATNTKTDIEVDIDEVITDLNSKANDIDVVHKTGNETIAGEKTFTGNINIRDKKGVYCKTTEVAYNETPLNQNVYTGYLQVDDKNGDMISHLYTALYTSGSAQMGMNLKNKNNEEAILSIRYDSDGTTFYTECPPSDKVKSIVTTTGINKAQNGYVKLGNGLIIQWGTSAKGSSKSVTLPTAFTSTNYKVAVNNKTDNGGGYYSSATSYTTTSFTIKSSGGAVSFDNDWIAIGY